MGVNEAESPATPWDQRVVRGLTVADSARSWAIALRVIGILVIAATLLANYLLVYGSETFDTAERIKLATFLQQTAMPVAFAGMVFGLSILVSAYASRLDLDIVNTDNEENGGSGSADAGDVSPWGAPLPPQA